MFMYEYVYNSGIFPTLCYPRISSAYSLILHSLACRTVHGFYTTIYINWRFAKFEVYGWSLLPGEEKRWGSWRAPGLWRSHSPPPHSPATRRQHSFTVLRIRITFMRIQIRIQIRILPFALMRILIRILLMRIKIRVLPLLFWHLDTICSKMTLSGFHQFTLMRIWILLFTLMRIRIQLPKMMRNHADTDPDPQHCSFIHKNNSTILSSKKLLVRGKYFPGSSFIPSLCLLVG